MGFAARCRRLGEVSQGAHLGQLLPWHNRELGARHELFAKHSDFSICLKTVFCFQKLFSRIVSWNTKWVLLCRSHARATPSLSLICMCNRCCTRPSRSLSRPSRINSLCLLAVCIHLFVCVCMCVWWCVCMCGAWYRSCKRRRGLARGRESPGRGTAGVHRAGMR